MNPGLLDPQAHPQLCTVVTVFGHVQGKGASAVKVRLDSPGSEPHQSGEGWKHCSTLRGVGGVLGPAKQVGAHSEKAAVSSAMHSILGA